MLWRTPPSGEVLLLSIMRFSSLGGLLPLLLGTPLFVDFERTPLTFSFMTRPIVGSSSLGRLLPFCIFVGDSPI